MTRFTCPECGKDIKAPCESSSKRMECPHCHDIVLVPTRQALIAPAADPHDQQAPGLIAWVGEGIHYTTQPHADVVQRSR